VGRRILVGFDDLEWPWNRGRDGSNCFSADIRNYARTGWPRMTIFGTVIQVGEERVSEGSATHASHSKVRGPSVPEFLEPLTCALTIWKTATKFCVQIKVDERKFVTGASELPALAKISGDSNADARSVSGC